MAVYSTPSFCTSRQVWTNKISCYSVDLVHKKLGCLSRSNYFAYNWKKYCTTYHQTQTTSEQRKFFSLCEPFSMKTFSGAVVLDRVPRRRANFCKPSDAQTTTTLTDHTAVRSLHRLCLSSYSIVSVIVACICLYSYIRCRSRRAISP